MQRSRVGKSVAGSLLLLTAIYAVTAACGSDAFDPCFSTDQQILTRGQLDGFWGARSVDGQPSSNYKLPGNPLSKDTVPTYFVNGTIDFKTRETEGACEALKFSSGYAVANYVTKKGVNGPPKPARFVGRFRYDHVKNEITLSAVDYEVEGVVSGNNMLLQIPHPVWGSYLLGLIR